MAKRKINNYKLLANHAYYLPGVSGMFALFGLFLIGSVLGSLAIPIGNSLGLEDYSLMVSYAISFLPAMMFVAVKGLRNAAFDTGYALDNDNFAPVGGWVLAALAVVGTLALGYISDTFTSLLPQMPEWLENMLKNLTSNGPIWVSFVTVSILAPFFEEWLCRGMVLRGLLHFKNSLGKGIRPGWAIAISALFFAVLHMNPWQGLAAFMLGCLFGYVYWKTGSLKLTMLMHFTNNTLALIMSECFPELSESESWIDVLPLGWYLAGWALCLALMVLFFIVFRKVHVKDSQGNCDMVDSQMPLL